MRHDVDVTDDEYERAVLSEAQPAQPAAQKVMQHAQALALQRTATDEGRA